MTQKGLMIKRQIGKLEFLKLKKKNYASRDRTKKMKRNATGREEIVTNMYLIRDLNLKYIKTNFLVNVSPRNLYRWSIYMKRSSISSFSHQQNKKEKTHNGISLYTH